ncbi:MAG: hypothetical protein JST82_01505 [Bacteroidetes bacterium]|nr:hypothetical protein [Bacteroidota bacterium]
MNLRLLIQQTATYDVNMNPIYYGVVPPKKNNPQNLSAIHSTLPASRQWVNYGNYIDITDDASNLYKLKLTWTAERDNEGFITPGASQTKKGSSGTITIEGNAYKMLKQWLVDDISAPLNSVDVKIAHKDCNGEYLNYTIKSTDLRWCENSVCKFDVTIKQKDEALSCIMRTMIADNRNNMFDESILNNPKGRKHPRFSYCNEQRPNGMMTMLWWIVNTTAGFIFIAVLPILLMVNLIIRSILLIINSINFIIGFLRKLGLKIGLIPTDKFKVIDMNDLFDPLAQYFLESAGCGREHPAPLIRDYIQNVCTICNVHVDEVSVPMFFARDITIQTSDPNRGNNGVITSSNPHYNACYFNAPVKRGIRRYNSLVPVIPLITSNTKNDTDFYIRDNSPMHTLDTFLDELKELYNAEWRVKNNTLYFWRKDWFLQTDRGPLYDFSTNSADRLKILEGICFEWNERKTPAYTEGLYQGDAADTCGNEAKAHMNAFTSFGSVEDNPTFAGKMDKITAYGATKFRLDGASEDYICDALQVVANSATITPNPFFTFQLKELAPYFEEYADYALLLKDETCTLPKILIWDGQRYENARCIRNYYASNIGPMPISNPNFNGPVKFWDWVHPPQTFVKGSGANFGSFPYGYYTVRTALGIAKILQQPAMLINYPMFFEPGFYDTMWDWFHWIDDPRLKPVLNQTWTAKIDLCCEDLNNLNVFGNATNIELGEKVILPHQYYNEGTLTEIEVSYDPTDDKGQYIQLKGTV